MYFRGTTSSLFSNLMTKFNQRKGNFMNKELEKLNLREKEREPKVISIKAIPIKRRYKQMTFDEKSKKGEAGLKEYLRKKNH